MNHHLEVNLLSTKLTSHGPTIKTVVMPVNIKRLLYRDMTMTSYESYSLLLSSKCKEREPPT